MSDAPEQQQGGQEQGLGAWFPSGPLPLVFETFAGINTEASRPGIRDDQMFVCDQFFPIGPNNLRTLWGEGAAVMTAQNGANITQFWFGVIGPNGVIPFVQPILFIVQDDGSVWQNAYPGQLTAVINVLPAGSIAHPGIGHVGFSQWGRNYILIVADGTNEYWAWDGATLYGPGDVVPSPYATMPTGVSGTSIEVYQNRAWIINGGVLLFSAPGDFTTWSTMAGGGATPINDSNLRYTGVRLLSVNGFLYLIGDSEIDYISNVQATVAGDVTTTTFSIQNADPDTGSPFPAAIDTFGPTIIFANPWGVQQSAGGAARKISDALDGIYNTGSAGDVLAPIFLSTGFQPSSAKAIIFGKKVWMLLFPVKLPITAPSYCTSAIIDMTPVEGSTGGALANTPATFTTALFFVPVYLPDTETNAGLVFSNQDNDEGSPNPGVQIAIVNDATDGANQVYVNCYDGSSNPIVQATYSWTNWTGFVYFMISIDTTSRTLQVLANPAGVAPTTTLLTPNSITWSSSTALQNASGHPWHFLPLNF